MRTNWCWNLQAPAATRVPAAVPDLIEGLVRNLRPSALGNMVLHRLGAPGIYWRHLLPRHANVRVVVIFCVDAAGAAGSVTVNTAFEAVLHPLASAVGVADAGAVPVALFRVC